MQDDNPYSIHIDLRFIAAQAGWDSEAHRKKEVERIVSALERMGRHGDAHHFFLRVWRDQSPDLPGGKETMQPVYYAVKFALENSEEVRNAFEHAVIKSLGNAAQGNRSKNDLGRVKEALSATLIQNHPHFLPVKTSKRVGNATEILQMEKKWKLIFKPRLWLSAVKIMKIRASL